MMIVIKKESRSDLIQTDYFARHESPSHHKTSLRIANLVGIKQYDNDLISDGPGTCHARCVGQTVRLGSCARFFHARTTGKIIKRESISTDLIFTGNQ